MPNHFKVIAPATGLEVGTVVTNDELASEHKNLGGVDRLLQLKAIESITATEAERIRSDKAKADANSPQLTTGDDADKVSGPLADAQQKSEPKRK